MGLFNTQALGDSLLASATSLFNKYSPVQLTPAGTAPVQARLPATNTGTPAQDPIAGAGSNGITTGNKNSGGLFGGSVSPALLIVGTLVAVAAVVLIARR